MKKIIEILFSIALCSITLHGCQNERVFSIEGECMGTVYEILYIGKADEQLPYKIDSLLKDLEHSCSIFDSSSLISRINRNETDSLTEDLKNIILCALKISGETNGAFDITSSPLINLWGFGNTSAAEKQDIDSLLKYVGYKKISVKENKLVKEDDRIQLNLNAIAKGFAVDFISEFIKMKYKNFLINIGGEIIASGRRINGEMWKVGIQIPTKDSLEEERYCDKFSLNEKAVATSGNYRRYRIDSTGKRYSHIINPINGYSENSDILSSTVIADNCMTADAYATAFTVLGLDSSMKILERHKELSACFICGDKNGFKIIKTENFPEK